MITHPFLLNQKRQVRLLVHNEIRQRHDHLCEDDDGKFAVFHSEDQRIIKPAIIHSLHKKHFQEPLNKERWEDSRVHSFFLQCYYQNEWLRLSTTCCALIRSKDRDRSQAHALSVCLKVPQNVVSQTAVHDVD